MSRVALLVCALTAFQASAYWMKDSLKSGTAGNLVGGQIVAEGWKVTAKADRLWYGLPRLVEGSIEFTVTGMSTSNLSAIDHEIFAMYEAGYGITEPVSYGGAYRENHYKAMIRIYGQQEP